MSFRDWLNKIYGEYTLEAEHFRDYLNKPYGEYTLEAEHENAPSRLDAKTFFNKYKWWLRKQYRAQCRKN